MMKRSILAAALAGTTFSAAAADVVWSNVQNYPDDLAKTTDGWSAVRMEDPQFISHRCAADDFTLDKKTKITRITFYGVELGKPEIYGGDWYIMKGPAAGPPDTLLYYEPNAPMKHEQIGVNNPNFGPVYLNAMEPADLVLEPGHYFLAFRTFQAFVPGEKNNNGALTTRWGNGTSTSWWTFGLLADGTLTDPWVPMKTFNLVEEQEWAFIIEGVPAGCAGDINGDGKTCQEDLGELLAAYGTCEGMPGYNPKANLAKGPSPLCPGGPVEGIDQADLGALLADYGCGGCP